MKKILAIPGSVRASSSNHRLLRSIGEMMAPALEVVIFDGIASLPHFDPGVEEAPGPVAAFRQLLRASDGRFGHQALLETFMAVLEMGVTPPTCE